MSSLTASLIELLAFVFHSLSRNPESLGLGMLVLLSPGKVVGRGWQVVCPNASFSKNSEAVFLEAVGFDLVHERSLTNRPKSWNLYIRGGHRPTESP